MTVPQQASPYIPPSQPVPSSPSQLATLGNQPPTPATHLSSKFHSDSPRPPLDFDDAPPPVPRGDAHIHHMEHERQYWALSPEKIISPKTGGIETWDLPTGWKLGTRDSDGRIYYWEIATGRTSWNHPKAPPHENTTTSRRGMFGMVRGNDQLPPNNLDSMGRRKPDSNKCCALFSCIVFPPLGICSLIHSYLTDRCWSRGYYGDSVDHSRQSQNYSWWAVFIAIIIFIYWRFFMNGDGWPGFNFDWMN